MFFKQKKQVYFSKSRGLLLLKILFFFQFSLISEDLTQLNFNNSF